jgi:hypothetical protein
VNSNMKDTISEHNDQETLAYKGVTDTITVLIEEASSALSCGNSNIVQTYREDILRSLKIRVDPHQHNNNRTLAIHIASVRNHIGNIRIALHEYETAYSFYETAYRMQRKVFVPINFNTSITPYNAGKCLHCLGRPDRALCYYNLLTKAIFSSIKAKLMTQETCMTEESFSMRTRSMHLFPKYVCNMMLVRIRVLVTMALLVGETETAFLVVATGDVGCWSRFLYQLRCFYQ